MSRDEIQPSLFEGAAVRAERERRESITRKEDLSMDNNALTEYIASRQAMAARAKAEWTAQQAENRRLMEHHLTIAKELLIDMGKPVSRIDITEGGSNIMVHMQTSVIRIWIGDIDSEQNRRIAVTRVMSAVAGC